MDVDEVVEAFRPGPFRRLLARIAPGLAADLEWTRRNRLRSDGDYALTIAEHAAAMTVLPEQVMAIQSAALATSQGQLLDVLDTTATAIRAEFLTAQTREGFGLHPTQGWLEVMRTCSCDTPTVIFHLVDAPDSGITRFSEHLLVKYPHAELRIHHLSMQAPAWKDRFGGVASCERQSTNAPSTNVVVLGNNWDHVELVRRLSLQKMGTDPSTAQGPWIAYLHDPTLWYLLEGVFDRSFKQFLRQDYGAGIDRVAADSALVWGMSGVRTLLRTIALDGVITNSTVGAAMLEDELQGLAPLGVCSVHHPSLVQPEPDVAEIDRPHEPHCPGIGNLLRAQGPYIGSFGIPVDWKLPGVVVDAFEVLKQHGMARTLVFAGYRAHQVLAYDIRARADVVVLSDLCESCMQQAMQACLLALQPRAILGGEASGAVSLLMGLNVPTVASRGLGNEPEGPVRLVSVNPDATELAVEALLLAEWSRQRHSERTENLPDSPETAVTQYLAALEDAVNTLVSHV